jgi:hypothetical protein
METKICIYCGRALDMNLLIDKAGKYRCKDENNCLDYQTREDPADSIENADYISNIVKSSLSEAAQRIAVYKGAKDDQAKGGAEDHAERSEESLAEFTWMKSVVDALALEYQKNQKFVFQYDETMKNEYIVSFNDADHHLYFTVKIDHISGSRYSLTVAREERVADTDPLYGEFIYKSYPIRQREDVIEDLSVILIVLEKEKDMIPALLYKFRNEIESRYYRCDEAAGR